MTTIDKIKAELASGGHMRATFVYDWQEAVFDRAIAAAVQAERERIKTIIRQHDSLKYLDMIREFLIGAF